MESRPSVSCGLDLVTQPSFEKETGVAETPAALQAFGQGDAPFALDY